MYKYVLSLLLCGILLSCNQDVGQTQDPADYEAFAKLLEKEINESDAEFFNRHFMLDKILVQATSRADAPEEYVEAFIAGVAGTLDVGREIVHSLGFGGYYTFLGLKDEKLGSATALFRLVEESGLNYHEVYLEQKQDGNIGIRDIYVVMGGEVFGKTLERLFLAGLADTEANYQYKIQDKAGEEFLASLPVLAKVEDLLAHGDYEAADEAMKEISKKMQEDKIVLLRRLNIAHGFGEEEYQAVVEDFARHHPEDPALDLLQIDYRLHQKDYEGALEAIDALDGKIGGDPYLKVRKAQIRIDQGEIENAVLLLEASIVEEPENDEAYWALADLRMGQEDYPAVIRIWERMHKQFKVNPAEFYDSISYPNLFQSAVVAQWMTDNPVDHVH